MINLQKIPSEKWVTFITGNFKESGKSISEEDALRIATWMKNHPVCTAIITLYME
jgi:hypothetical protein